MTLADLKKLSEDYLKVLGVNRVRVVCVPRNPYDDEASELWGRGIREFCSHYNIQDQQLPKWMTDDLELPENLQVMFGEFEVCLCRFSLTLQEAKPPSSLQ